MLSAQKLFFADVQKFTFVQCTSFSSFPQVLILFLSDLAGSPILFPCFPIFTYLFIPGVPQTVLLSHPTSKGFPPRSLPITLFFTSTPRIPLFLPSASQFPSEARNLSCTPQPLAVKVLLFWLLCLLFKAKRYLLANLLTFLLSLVLRELFGMIYL